MICDCKRYWGLYGTEIEAFCQEERAISTAEDDHEKEPEG